MLSPQAVATLLIVAGLSMVAGWAVAFRNRYYLALLGLFFLTLAGALLAADKVRHAQQFGASEPGLATLAKALFISAAVFMALALVAAVQEVRRRLAEMRESYRAAEEAFMAMAQAAKEKQEAAKAEEPSHDQRDQQ